MLSVLIELLHLLFDYELVVFYEERETNIREVTALVNQGAS